MGLINYIIPFIIHSSFNTCTHIHTYTHLNRYLAFAMVLPGHPYSDTLKQSLKVVAPIYSEITTLVASRGYEFHEFAQQYVIRDIINFPSDVYIINVIF